MRLPGFLLLMVLLTLAFAWGNRPTMAAENECGDGTSFDFPDPAAAKLEAEVLACVPRGQCVATNEIDAGLLFCHEKAESKCSARKCASELQDCHPTFSNTKESKFTLAAAAAPALPCKPAARLGGVPWIGCKFTLTVNPGDHIRCWCNCGSAIYFPKRFRTSPHIN